MVTNQEGLGELKHIRVRQTDGREFMADLRRKIRGCEEQYGMTSAEMAALVKSDQIYETLEIFLWMSNYRVLASLRRGDPHGWNSFQNYLIRHNKGLDEHPFLNQFGALDFQEITAGGVARISVWGDCLCRRPVSLIIRKELAFRYVGHTLQVRGVSFNYVAWIPGRNLVLKYHNWHENPERYIPRAYNPQTGQQILYRPYHPSTVIPA